MEKSGFDAEFEKHIVASFFGRDFREGADDCLRRENFNDKVVADVAEVVRDFIVNERDVPGWSALFYEVEKKYKLAPGERVLHFKAIKDIYEYAGNNRQYYRGKIGEFVRVRAFSRGLADSRKLLEEGKSQEAMSLVQKVLGGLVRSPGVIRDYFAEIEERARDYFYRREGQVDPGKVQTGFAALDAAIGGGLGPGESGVVIALPKHGKTTTLICFAVNALLSKRKVLYVTLELSDKIIGAKFDSNFFRAPVEEILKKPKAFRDRLFQLRDEMRGTNLRIIKYSTGSLSLLSLQAAIERFEPQVVMVDYAGLLKASQRKDEKMALTEIYQGLERIADECKVPIWTAHQANRPSQAVERKTIDIEHIAGDFNIPATCDVCVSLNQTSEERLRNRARFYVSGNRLGPSGDTIELETNWALSSIKPYVPSNFG